MDMQSLEFRRTYLSKFYSRNHRLVFGTFEFAWSCSEKLLFFLQIGPFGGMRFSFYFWLLGSFYDSFIDTSQEVSFWFDFGRLCRLLRLLPFPELPSEHYPDGMCLSVALHEWAKEEGSGLFDSHNRQLQAICQKDHQEGKEASLAHALFQPALWWEWFVEFLAWVQWKTSWYEIMIIEAERFYV